MRSLLVEAGHTAARLDHQLRQDYQRLKLRTRWRRSQGCDRQKIGGTHVLDAAHPGQLRAAGAHARQPQGHPGGPVSHRWPDWAPCLPEKVGESEQPIMVGSRRSNRWLVEPDVPPQDSARGLSGMSKKQKQPQKQNPQRRESQSQNLRRSTCLLTTPARL